MGHNPTSVYGALGWIVFGCNAAKPRKLLAANGLAKVDDRKVFITTVYDSVSSFSISSQSGYLF